jgi:hypothetical protein
MLKLLPNHYESVPAGEPALDDLIESAITKNVLEGDRAHRKGNFELAEQFYCYAINLAEVKFGTNAAAVGYLLGILADLYETQNRKSDASSLKNRVHEILTNYVKVPDQQTQT